jgi:hypothetical protein
MRNFFRNGPEEEHNEKAGDDTMLHVDDLDELSGIGCIFLDMDGTLINDNKEISDENIRELERMQEKGIRLIIATGRPRSTIPELPSSLHFDYYITSNGAAIYDHNRETIYRKNIAPETILQAAEHFTKDDYPEYFIEGETHVDQWQIDQIDDYELPVTNRRSLIKRGYRHENLKADIAAEKIGCEKICVYFSRPYEASKAQRLRESTAVISGIRAVSGGPDNLEFTDINVSKAIAVRFVLDRMGLTENQALAFGDSENDMDLFCSVTYAIAVENACDALKKQAYAMTRSNNDHGVAYALKKLIR